MGRILAIDYGKKRIGIAVTDPMQMIATRLTTVASHEIWIFLKDYFAKENVEKVIVGYPMQMNNQPSEAVLYINPFLKKFQKDYPEMPLEQVDERFTSKMAFQTMIDAGLKKKDRQNKGTIDGVSATIILQSYLEQKIHSMIYPVTVFGDPILRKKAEPVTSDFQDLKGFIENMFDTMYNSDGVGLAAPQVGKTIRIFVIDSMIDDEDELPGIKKAFINPEIIEKSGDEWLMNEGCLSLPEIREDILRPETIKIKYFDEEFNEYIETYSGFTSRVIQHEYDHLEGVMFVDYLNPLKKRILKGKLSAISKGKVIPKYRIKVPGK